MSFGRPRRSAKGAALKDDAAKDETPKASAYDRALGLLSRREHSERELKTKLAIRGFEKAEAGRAVDTARDHDFQSNGRFAELTVRRRAGAGYGPRYIEAELKSHGIDPRQHRESIDAVDWGDHALTALRRKNFELTSRAGRMKASQYLARRGFDSATIKSATGIAATEANDSEL